VCVWCVYVWYVVCVACVCMLCVCCMWYVVCVHVCVGCVWCVVFLEILFYLFLAVFDFHYCSGFSLVAASRGCYLVSARGFFIAVVSFVAEHGL